MDNWWNSNLKCKDEQWMYSSQWMKTNQLNLRLKIEWHRFPLSWLSSRWRSWRRWTSPAFQKSTAFSTSATVTIQRPSTTMTKVAGPRLKIADSALFATARGTEFCAGLRPELDQLPSCPVLVDLMESTTTPDVSPNLSPFFFFFFFLNYKREKWSIKIISMYRF